MSSSTLMTTVHSRDVEFDDMVALNFELAVHLSSLGWEIDSTPDFLQNPNVVSFESHRLCIRNGDTDDTTTHLQVWSWDDKTGNIIARHMIKGVIVQQLVWEQEDVSFQILRPGIARTVSASEMATYWVYHNL